MPCDNNYNQNIPQHNTDKSAQRSIQTGLCFRFDAGNDILNAMTYLYIPIVVRKRYRIIETSSLRQDYVFASRLSQVLPGRVRAAVWALDCIPVVIVRNR